MCFELSRDTATRLEHLCGSVPTFSEFGAHLSEVAERIRDTKSESAPNTAWRWPECRDGASWTNNVSSELTTLVRLVRSQPNRDAKR
jgi:hypothetical protein